MFFEAAITGKKQAAKPDVRHWMECSTLLDVADFQVGFFLSARRRDLPRQGNMPTSTLRLRHGVTRDFLVRGSQSNRKRLRIGIFLLGIYSFEAIPTRHRHADLVAGAKRLL